MACNDKNVVVDGSGNVLVEDANASNTNESASNTTEKINVIFLGGCDSSSQSCKDSDGKVTTGYKSLSQQKSLLTSGLCNGDCSKEDFTIEAYGHYELGKAKEAIKSKPKSYVVLFSISGQFSEDIAKTIKDNNGEVKKLYVVEPYSCTPNTITKINNAINQYGLVKKNIWGGGDDCTGKNVAGTFSKDYENCTNHYCSVVQVCKQIKKEAPIVKKLDKKSGKLPFKITGSYSSIAGGDALHTFDRRKSDFWGGYMLRVENTLPAKWADRVKVGTQGGEYAGKGVNFVLKDLVKKGIKPKVTEIFITIDWQKKSVSWSFTIDEGTDSNYHTGVATRGSIGKVSSGNYDTRADAQIPKLKQDNPSNKNWTSPTIYYNTKKMTKKFKDGHIPLEDPTNKLRQYFLAYT